MGMSFSPETKVDCVRGIATGRPLSGVPKLLGVRAAQFLSDGGILVTLSVETERKARDKERWLIRRWRWGTGEEVGKPVLVDENQKTDGAWQWSPDGKLLIATGYDPPVALWDARTGARLREIKEARRGTITPDGQCLILSSPRGGLNVYETATGKHLRQLARDLPGRKVGGFYDVFASPDGTMVAAPIGETLSVFDLRTGERLVSEDGGYGRAFSPDSKWLASANPKSIRIFDARTLKTARELPHEFGRSANVLQFSGDGKCLVVRVRETVRHWDLTTGKLIPAPPSHSDTVLKLAFSPDGKRLATGSHDCTVRVWDVATSRQLHCFAVPPAVVASLAFSPDGKTLATAEGRPGYRGETDLRFFELPSGRLLRRFPAHVNGVSTILFSPDGKRLATGGGDDRIRLWDVATGRRLGQVCDLTHPRPLAFLDKGKSLLVNEEDGHQLFDVESLRSLATLPVTMRTAGVYLPEQRLIVAAAVVMAEKKPDHGFPGRETLITWRELTGKVIRSVRLPVDDEDVCLSPDANLMANRSGPEGFVALWDLQSGKRFASINTGPRGHREKRFSPDGRWLATAGENGLVLLWDVERLRSRYWLAEVLAGRGDARRFAVAPGWAVEQLAARLLEVAESEKRVARLIVDLDNDDFDTRESASQALMKFGVDAAFGLMLVVKDGTPEGRLRARKLLDRLDKKEVEKVLLPENTRPAIGVLARIDDPAARRSLAGMAERFPMTLVGKEARAALERLNKEEKKR